MDRLKHRYGRRGRSGASLVEVMVVLVVLLIGVFAVIRVFPVGFQFLRSGENRTLAGRLAQAMMEQAKTDAQNLPDAVLYSYYRSQSSPPGVVSVVNEDPDNFNTNTDSPDRALEDVNKVHYVKGEAVKIGLPTPTAFGAGFLYMVKFGPLFIDSSVTAASDPTAYAFMLNVYSAPLISADSQANSAGGTINPYAYRGALSSPRSYVLDPGLNGDPNGGGDQRARILFAPSTKARTFQMQFLLLQNDANDNVPATLVARTVQIPVAANAFDWILIPGLNTTDRIAPGSEVVTRIFDRLAPAATFTDDPYEYKLLSSNIVDVNSSVTKANLGILAFNPAGANYSEDTNSSVRAFSAYVDYEVLDWHILRDDRQVPSVFADSAGAVPVRLTMSKLKQNGDINADNTLYDGIFGSGSGANQDLVVVRLDTGAILSRGNYDLRTGSDANSDYWIRDDRGGTWDTGTLYVNTNRVPQGTPIRILYKADGDWAVGIQKAASQYRAWRLTQQGPPPIQVPADVIPYDGDSQVKKIGDPTVFGLQGTRIYFTGSELNKSVTLRLESWDTNGQRRRSAPMQLTIDTQEGDYAYVDVARYLPTNLQRWKVVDGIIRGVSIKVRVIWRERNDFRAPWRVQDLDSYLTQETLR